MVVYLSDDLLGGLDDFGYDEDNWEETPKEKKEIKKAKTKTSFENIVRGMNLGLVSEEMKGKSLLATLIGYVNLEYCNNEVKEAFPKTYEILHTGLVPEVERIDVLDMDCSYEKLSHLGKFWKLSKKLYNDDKIHITKFKMPKRQIKFIDGIAKEAAKIAIQQKKIEIENTISERVKNNGPEVVLLNDSLSSYDELLNDLFRIVYEEVINKSEDKDTLGSSLKGIRQSYYQIRNGWWVETLRDLRTYKGWNIDTFKKEPKSFKYLQLEIESAKKEGKSADDVSRYIIQWATKTEFDLDLVFHIDNDRVNYWVDLKSRFEGNVPKRTNQRIYYTPDNIYAFWEILEEIAPHILGEVAVDGSELTEKDIFKIPKRN
jgi:hypothetical protein